MYLLIISGFLSSSLVFADLNNANVDYQINDGEKIIEEVVDLNFRDNYIKISAPAIDGKTPVTMIHQLTEHMSQWRQAGHCIMLPINEDGFHGVLSSDMDHWLHVHVPLVMQNECDAMYPATLYNVIHGRDAKRYLDNTGTPYAGIIYGPDSHGHHVHRKRNNSKFKREKFTAKTVAIVAAAAGAVGLAGGVAAATAK